MTRAVARLGGPRVLVVGVGGLGCPAALALANGLGAAGTLGLVDADVVDVTNLHRQILFDDADVGAPKVDVAAKKLRASTPIGRIETHRTRLDASNARELVAAYDLVVEGSDNFGTKFLVADAAHISKRPVVHAAAVRWHGTALAVGAGGKPCYRCLFEDLPEGEAPNCATAGVLGPMVGVVAAVQADLALSMLAGEAVAGTLFTFDARTLAARRRRVSPRTTCALCGDLPAISGIEAFRYAEMRCDPSSEVSR